MVFDLIPTKRASNDFNHSKLINYSFSIEFMFSGVLPSDTKILIIKEKTYLFLSDGFHPFSVTAF